MTIALWQRPLARVVQGIVKAGNGCWLDPSDLSTLYQDAAGTVPVTAVEQPVGKIIDKSGNGNHATQSITASRPVLSARYNLLTKTEDFSDTSAWQGNGVNITSNVYKTPFSLELLADKITIPTSSGAPHFVYHQPLRYIAGLTYTYTHNIAYAGYRYVQLTFASSAFGASQYANFDLQSGVVTAQSGGTASIESTANGFFKISFSATATTTSAAGSALAYIDSPTSGRLPLLTGDGLSGYYLFGASLVIGTSAGPYQRVNTATDYDTDPRYFPKYLRFDGVDDYLNLPYMNLYNGGAASIICARDAVSQATDTYIISERSTTDVDPKYFPSRQLANGGNMDAYISDDVAAVVLDTTGSVFGGAADKVIRSVVDTGNNLKLYKNGGLAADDSYTRTGTLTLNNTTIGASVSTTTGNYAAMKLYSLIITKSALTDAQRIKCERYAASKAGVIL